MTGNAPAEIVRPAEGEAVDPAKLWADMDAIDAKGTPAGDAAVAEAAPSAESKDEAVDASGKPASADPAVAEDKGTPALKPEPAASAPDIWATAPAELKAAHEAAQSRIKTLEKTDQSHRGRLSAQDRELTRLRNLGKTAQPAATVEKSATVADLLKDDPDFQALQKDFPEVGKPIGAVLQRMVDRMTKAIEPVKAEVSGITAEREGRHLELQDEIVRTAHSDYDEITKSKDFHDWYQRAPAYVKAGIERNGKVIVDGQEVADIVSRFKGETGRGQASPAATAADPQPAASTDPKRKLQLASATQPKPKGQAQVTAGQPTDPEAIWKALDEKDARRKAASR